MEKSIYIYIYRTQQTTLGNAKNDNILGNIDEGYTMQHAILLLSFPCEMEWAREEETDREKNMKKSHLGYITIMLFWLCKSLWNCGNKRKGEKEQNFKYEYEYVYYCTYILHMIIYTIITHGTTIYQITYAIFGYENHIIRWMFWGQYSIVGIYWKIYGSQCARYRRWRWRCICYIYMLKYLYISAVGATFCGASGMKTQNILSDYKKNCWEKRTIQRKKPHSHILATIQGAASHLKSLLCPLPVEPPFLHFFIPETENSLSDDSSIDFHRQLHFFCFVQLFVVTVNSSTCISPTALAT